MLTPYCDIHTSLWVWHSHLSMTHNKCGHDISNFKVFLPITSLISVRFSCFKLQNVQKEELCQITDIKSLLNVYMSHHISKHPKNGRLVFSMHPVENKGIENSSFQCWELEFSMTQFFNIEKLSQTFCLLFLNCNCYETLFQCWELEFSTPHFSMVTIEKAGCLLFQCSEIWQLDLYIWYI